MKHYLLAGLAVLLLGGAVASSDASDIEPPAGGGDLRDARVLLAPDLGAWRAELAELSERAGAADALSVATLAEQNRVRSTPAECGLGAREQAALRGALFGTALRDEIQGLRRRLERLDETRTAPTLAPVLSTVDTERLERTRREIRRLVREYLDAAAWQRTHVGPWLRECGVRELTPYAGESPRVVAPRLVPVIARSAGVVMPFEAPVEAGVLLLEGPDPEACLQASGADPCEPVSVRPGAVLVVGDPS